MSEKEKLVDHIRSAQKTKGLNGKRAKRNVNMSLTIAEACALGFDFDMYEPLDRIYLESSEFLKRISK